MYHCCISFYISYIGTWIQLDQGSKKRSWTQFLNLNNNSGKVVLYKYCHSFKHKKKKKKVLSLFKVQTIEKGIYIYIYIKVKPQIKDSINKLKTFGHLACPQNSQKLQFIYLFFSFFFLRSLCYRIFTNGQHSIVGKIPEASW